jgi:two-component system sensor histidine kinase KdpD
VVGAAFLAVLLTTPVVWLLESAFGVPDASPVFLIPVVAIAIVFGIRGAVLTAVSSIAIYDYLFTEPQFTLTVADPGEWLELVLLLFVAVTVGQLAELQRRRAEAAVARERESRALFEVTRVLATRETTIGTLEAIAATLSRDAALDHVWFALGPDDATERLVAKGHPEPPPIPAGAWAIPHPVAGGPDHGWTVVRNPTTRRPAAPGVRHYRVRLEDAGQAVGSIWATRTRDAPDPDPATTRLLRVAADLVAQALAHDRLADERRRAEVAQQSDALKTALVESVSHDLRTPLASIRAFAGTLMDPDVSLGPDETRASAAAIDREAQRLNRLVGNLLDLGRIEGGSLRAAQDALDLEDVVERAFVGVRPRIGGRPVVIDVEPGVTVRADPVLLEQALVNLLDNAVQHTPDGSTIRISARPPGSGTLIRLTIEDSGPGVPDAALPRLFERFFRAGRPSGGAGTGIGLAVVRGFVAAMGGRVEARRAELGGLAVDVDLPAVATPVPTEVGR